MPFHTFLIKIALSLVLAVCWAGWLQAGEPRDHPAELADLKFHFINEIGRASEPGDIMAVSLVSAGRTWAVAASGLAEQYHHGQLKIRIEGMEREILKELETTKEAAGRQILGMRLFYHSVHTAALALARQDKAIQKEIETIDAHVGRTFDLDRGHLHSLVVLSGGAMSMLALAIRAADPDRKFAPQVNRELKARLEQARSIRLRGDIHNRGKYFLMALNNFKGCFRLIQTFSLAVDEGLAREIEPIERAWRKHTGGNQPPSTAMVVTLTALAEAGFPVAAALVRR